MVTRRTLGLSLMALAVPSARAVMDSGGCFGYLDPIWPRGSVIDGIAQQIAAGHIWRLDLPYKAATKEQWAAHISAIFPQLVEQGFARLPAKLLNQRLLLSSDAELAGLAQLYTADLNALSRGGLALPMAAARCSDAALARLANAFGTAPVYEAIAMYAPGKLSAFALATEGRMVLPGLNQQAFVPNVDMTLKRIYDGFRLAPTGATSIPGALYQTVAYAGPRLLGAYGFGQLVGTYIVAPLIQTFAPTLWNSIGSGINDLVNGLSGLTGVPLGQAQESISYNFGLSSLHDRLEQTGGDYAAVEEWANMAGYSYGGGGC